MAEALTRRGILTAQQARAFLDPALHTPAPAQALPGLDEAVQRLAQAARAHETVLIWGDFDVDGLAATAILEENLAPLGLRVRRHVPGRGEGHGVHLETLRRLLLQEPVQVLLTCDTGISAAVPVAYARGVGVDVVITDHHALPAELPAARAIVNPCFLPDDHPLRTLPGAGCAYLLAAALSAELGAGDASRSLDLLALAIVADVATQQGDVRYYLQRGLQALRANGRLGMAALLEVAGLNPDGLDEQHLGYTLGPRLNALGRLSDAAAGVELFLTQDLTRARTIASEMEGLNSRRQLLTGQVLQAAREQIERDTALREAPILIVGHPTWPGGIIGLVAGRLAERYGRPALVLTTPPDGLVRGSARSVPGIDIAAAIAALGDLLHSHGGHPMAAGLSLRPEHLPELRRRLTAEIARRAALAPPLPALALDAYLPLEAATPELARDLHRLSPFGPGNPPPLLAARRLRVAAQAGLGRTGEHRRLYLRDEAGHDHKVFWWQAGDQPAPEGLFDLAYTVRPRNYQGRDEATVEWLAVRVVEAAPAVIALPRLAYDVYDHRDDPAPETTLAALCATSPTLVYAEIAMPKGVEVVDRLSATAAEALALWTAPPGPVELASLLQRVQPRRVHLFAIDPGGDELDAFLRRLAGLVKYAVQHYGPAFDASLLERLAAQTGQRLTAVHRGLQWLAAQGWLLVAEQKGIWQVALQPGTPNPEAAQRAQMVLREYLRETAAYRAYARTADPHVLLAV
ncbi:MAG: single-stranded-DNA-specific exonuclease RecJ [Anaerolineae bacterium]